MAYKNLITRTFSEALEEYRGISGSNTPRKILTIKGEQDNDTLSNESDIIAYYDLAGDTCPLLVIERIPKRVFRREGLKLKLRKATEELSGKYVVLIDKTKKASIDVILVKESIYDELGKG